MISTSLNCIWYFLYIGDDGVFGFTIVWFYCSINTIYYSIPFLFSWKGGVGNLAALLSLVAQWVLITTIYSAAGGGSVVGLTIFCFQCWINIIVAPDFTLMAPWVVITTTGGAIAGGGLSVRRSFVFSAPCTTIKCFVNVLTLKRLLGA